MTFKEAVKYAKVNANSALWVDFNCAAEMRYRIVYNYEDGQSIVGYIRSASAAILLRDGHFDAEKPAYESEYTIVYRAKEQP